MMRFLLYPFIFLTEIIFLCALGVCYLLIKPVAWWCGWRRLL